MGFADMDRVEEGPSRRKSAEVRTPGGAGDEARGMPGVLMGRRAGRGSRGCLRWVGDDLVRKEVQALEDGGDDGPFESLRVE